jgi:uncharacterized protein (DUF885 family)
MSQVETPSQQLTRLIEEEWEFRLEADPLFATVVGDHRYDDRLPSATEEEHSRRLGFWRSLLQRLQKIDPAGLPANQRLDWEILVRLLDIEIGEIEFHTYRIPICKTFGFPMDLPDQLPHLMPLRTVSDYESYLARLDAFPRFFQEQIGVMRNGLATGYVPARVTLDGLDQTLSQFLVSDPTASPFWSPLSGIPSSLDGREQDRLTAEAHRVVSGSVVPAYRALLEFLVQEYLPRARSNIAASELPDGPAFYRHRVRAYTSLDLTPEAVHRTGLEEVARIRSEMEAVMGQVGFQGSFSDLSEFLRTDSRFYATSKDALLRETAYVLKRIDGELPRMFGKLPRMPYGIRPIPDASAPGSTAAYYLPPTGDGQHAGFYYVNTYDLPSRPLYEIEALSLHEAVPGHHLQIALQQELDLPAFRRFGGFTAFVEGWALYAERLGLEMGFYQDPYSNLGRLSFEMWRACRLVVDTGIHALQWPRQTAIDLMASNTFSTPLNIANEVDRYIAWPGQALAYKIGELKIRELRSRAERDLRPRFDARDFHDLVLGSGAVPLDVLERMVLNWVQERAA